MLGEYGVVCFPGQDLDPARQKAFAARDVLEQRSFSEAVDADDWEKSRQYGVTGVPTFVAGGYGVVGAQPYEALEQLLNTVAAEGTDGDAAE